MASQVNTTTPSAALQSSKFSNDSSPQSPALARKYLSSWFPKLKRSLRRLTPAVSSQSLSSLDLDKDDTKPLSANGEPEDISFETSDVATDDLCDNNIPLQENGELRVLEPIFQSYGKREKFAGPIVTIKLDDDNTTVWELVHTPGNGRVLLIDAGGQKRCAIIGGILTEIASYMGWAGIVVNGCIRDVDDLNAIDIGVRALAAHPVKPKKKAPGQKHVPVCVGGVLINDGEWLYSDIDGIVISKSPLDLQAAHKYKVDFEMQHSLKNKDKLRSLVR